MITHNNVTYSDVIELIDQRNIICIFQGQSEAGPRALGNRSILYDPRDTNALNVNEAKGREWWRRLGSNQRTFYVQGRRSTNCATPPKKFGSSGRTRTSDPMINSHLLYH